MSAITNETNALRNKVRLTLIRNLGVGLDYEHVGALLFNLKQRDLVRFGWFTTHYHVNRIYKDIFTFRIETETATTPLGQLKGRKCISALGKEYVRFQGIPYAKPPLGPLRFKAPEATEPWDGVKEALKEGPICCHFDFITGGVKGSEDCLYLNVFTPQLPTGPNFKSKAVLVWIHGGGFQLGSGNAEVYSPDFLLEEDVILVTLNYRLGALGFLSTDSEEAPGNAGLKDIVMALKWIQQNIESLGGDPKRVCIFGESAGAAAVQFLVLSPLAKGLFSTAIGQSGSAICPWAMHSEQKATAFKLGSKFGCDTADPKILLDCLRSIPAKTLAKKQNVALSEERKRICIPFAFLPCVEKPGPDAFLSEDPLVLLEKGDYNHVPYITGINEIDGMIMLRQLIDKKPPISDIEKDFERTVPPCLNLTPGGEKSKEVAKRMKLFYFKNQPFDKSTYKEYVDLSTDINFIDGMTKSSKIMSKTSSEPVYNYEFIFDGNFAIFKKLLNIDINGPTHADDIGYLFYVPVLGQKLNPNSPEMKITQRWVRMWCNFAKYKNPTPHNKDSILDFKWEKYDCDTKPYLEIAEKMTMKNNINAERAAFWEEIYSYTIAEED